MQELELPEETKARLAELKELSDRAEAGEEGARRELRRAVRESAPGVIARASDVGRKASRMLAKTAGGGEPLIEEALYARLDMMRAEIAGDDPTPLEVLLTEHVVSSWMLVALFDALMAGQLWKGMPSENRLTEQGLRYYLRWQEGANRRYLAAIREIARVRKLQAGAPAVRVNARVTILQG